MFLPAALVDILTQLLGFPPQIVGAVGGGDISAAARFSAGGQTYLVKWNASPPMPAPGWLDMFAAEAAGLKLLAGAHALRVPAVLAHSPVEGNQPAFILLEWIEGHGDRRRAGEKLGQRLADLHRATAPRYGLDHNNYCGATPQDNGWTTSWIELYGQRRLGFQMELAARRGHLPAQRRRRLEALIDRLPQWIDEDSVQPSLLHGDLWGGNWILGPAGEPVLIDPAVYYGHREAELAMCRLFGGFPHSFYAAYDAAWPPDPGREDRVSLYQLYHLLNHLNLFGEAYGGQVDAILRHYVGRGN